MGLEEDTKILAEAAHNCDWIRQENSYISEAKNMYELFKEQPKILNTLAHEISKRFYNEYSSLAEKNEMMFYGLSDGFEDLLERNYIIGKISENEKAPELKELFHKRMYDLSLTLETFSPFLKNKDITKKLSKIDNEWEVFGNEALYCSSVIGLGWAAITGMAYLMSPIDSQTIQSYLFGASSVLGVGVTAYLMSLVGINSNKKKLNILDERLKKAAKEADDSIELIRKYI